MVVIIPIPFLGTLSLQPFRQFPNSWPYLLFNQYPMAHTTKRRESYTNPCRIRPSPSGVRHSSSYKPITVPRQLSYQRAICNRKWHDLHSWQSLNFHFSSLRISLKFFHISLTSIRKIYVQTLIIIFNYYYIIISHTLCRLFYVYIIWKKLQ